ncbi:DUF1365 domain-containing protein [Leptospira noguchii]|nr:DUF1365 domain-containing protein [Leptospira noguchii]TQE75177.1 DUF1365 domain-containing protein [Leptospira noguchii]
MELNSCIYKAVVMHDRRIPKQNRFHYKIFTFALDLDELNELNSGLKFFGLDRANIFRFSKEDHLNFGKNSVKENILEYLKQNGVKEKVSKVLLITNLRVLGYVFNPVSFYYFYGEQDLPLCAVAEVGNTFGEQKPFFLGKESWKDEAFRKRIKKHFYVSPFINLDSEFDFILKDPQEQMNIRIEVIEKEKTIMVTTYTGKKIPISNLNLIKMFLLYPLATVKVIVLIHWQAFKLYLKGLPFIRKDENKNLQRGIYLGKD